MKRVWKDIPEYEGLYQVSNYGEIRKICGKNYKYLKPTKEEYYRVSLIKNNKRKTFLVHRLVALAFIPNPNKYLIINHKDENKLNNNVNNLEWCTHKYNNNYGRVHEKLKKNNANSKKIIIIETGQVFNSGKECSEFLKCHRSNPNFACNGKTKTCKGYHLMWLDEYNQRNSQTSNLLANMLFS